MSALAIGLLVLTSFTTLLAFTQWYGSKWVLNLFSKSMFAISALLTWTFVLVVTCVDEVSYTGMSSLIFALNFLPACYLLHEIKLRSGIDTRYLFKQVADELAKRNEGNNSHSIEKQKLENKILDDIMKKN